MSAEKIIDINGNDLPILKTPEKSKEASSPERVDIYDLLARVREGKKKEFRVNLIFFGMFCSLILVVVTIISF